MEIKEYLDRIIDNDKLEDMQKLSDIFEKTMEHLEKCDKNAFDKYEMELYEMANGKVLNQKMAEKIVNNMRPYGMKWTIDEIDEVKKQYGFNNLRTIDTYIVMNSAYNDFQDIFGDKIEMYIRYARDFIEDEDAKDGKVFLYFTSIPNENY